MSTLKPDTIRIIRGGNGKARAVPSPKELTPGEEFTVKNWTECDAAVDFSGVPVDPDAKQIGPNGAGSFKVTGEAPTGYYEYQVTLKCRTDSRVLEQYVEGGSRPGLIIDR